MVVAAKITEGEGDEIFSYFPCNSSTFLIENVKLLRMMSSNE